MCGGGGGGEGVVGWVLLKLEDGSTYYYTYLLHFGG